MGKKFSNNSEKEALLKSHSLDEYEKNKSFKEHLEKRRWVILLMFSTFT